MLAWVCSLPRNVGDESAARASRASATTFCHPLRGTHSYERELCLFSAVAMTPRGGVNIWVVHTLCQLSVALLFVPTLHCLPEWIKNICHLPAWFGPSWQDHLPLLVYSYLLTLSSVIAFCEGKVQVVYPSWCPWAPCSDCIHDGCCGTKGSASLNPFTPYNLPLPVLYVFTLNIQTSRVHSLAHNWLCTFFYHPYVKSYSVSIWLPFITWHVVGTL